MAIRLIDPATFRTVPWKNGGGTATDIAVGQDAGGVVWRVGTAAILRDGPFSDYEGVTRTFTIIEGPGVHLDLPDEGTRTLDRDQPTRFAGAPAPFCRLRDGMAATAFNLLTRDGAAGGDVAILTGGSRHNLPPADIVILFALEGGWSLDRAGLLVNVPAGWAGEARAAGPLAVAGPAGGRAALVTLRLAKP